MSLDELLKEPEKGSPWKGQRTKLLRLSLGLGAVVLALIAGAILIFTLKPTATKKISDVQTADNLAQLMRVRREAEKLQAGLAGRGPAGVSQVRGRGVSTHVVSYDPGEGFTSIAPTKPEDYIPTGAVFQAQMLTPIKTSVAKTFVMAETTHEYRMDQKRKIPPKSRLIGHSYFDPVLKGVVVEFVTLVLPNGKETAISALALSRNALPELEGLYFSNQLVTYGTALAFGFLSGFADAAREREVTVLGSQPQVSLGNQVLSGLSTASFQVADQMLRDIQSRAIEYVVIPAGEQVFVALTRKYDMVQGGPR